MEENNIFRRVEWVIAAALASTKNQQTRDRIEDIRCHSNGYAEPGYIDPESGVVACGNWNNISEWDKDLHRSVTIDGTVGRLAAVLEKLGCELEWSDEWADCSECGKLIRTSPDSYSWTPSYIAQDCEVYCTDCADGKAYLEEMEGDPGSISQNFYPGDYGYVLIQDDFEHGFHRGQDADPKLIGNLMSDAGFSRWVFYLDGKGQFDVKFSLWLHEEEAANDDGNGIILAKRVIERGNTDGPSVAEAMSRGLQEAAVQHDRIRNTGEDGIIVSHVSMGGASSRVISNEDFIEGGTLDIE